MASAAHHSAPDTRRSPDQSERRPADARGTASEAIGSRAQTLARFWTKIMNDWILNLAGLLAYNFLMSVFPILLVLLAVGGLFLGSVSPRAESQLTAKITHALPSGTGGTIIAGATYSLTHSAGLLLIVGIVVSLVTGSGLFIVLENCFGVIFKLRGRPPIIQNLMAIAMLLFYVILIPIVVLGSILPATILRALPLGNNNPLGGFLFQAAGDAVSVAIAIVLFGTIYVVVPNRRVRVREVWKGTLVAAGLLVIYETIFPIYVSTFLHPREYGSTAGFAVVVLLFFYYLAFILLLGAEVNSWAMGQREMASDIVAVLHEVQAHNTTRGAAGPTAGMPQEDVEHHRGAAAMRDIAAAVAHERRAHSGDGQPARYAEAGIGPEGYVAENDAELRRAEAAARARRTVAGNGDPRAAPSLPPREPASRRGSVSGTQMRSVRAIQTPAGRRHRRMTFGALLAAGTVALAPVAGRILVRRRRPPGERREAETSRD